MQAVWASRERKELEEAIWNRLKQGVAGRRAKGPGTAYAFELWIAHLVLLDRVLSVAAIPWERLRDEELEWLLLLRTARERLQREYRPCAECGAAVKGKICPRCGAVG